MRIAVPSMGEEQESLVSDRLGHCSHIIFYDTKSKEIFAFPNPGLLVEDGSGIKTADAIIRAGADLLISMQIGMKAYSVLAKEHVKVQLLKSVSSVKDILKSYQQIK
jgi:predicted Fe-Mo cluster-binding NifX family protein